MMEPALPHMERQFIERLRARYEDRGFAFTAEPAPDQLPAFLGAYRPDAVARKQGRNEVIELKRRPGGADESTIRDLQRLFEGHPDWQLRVFYLADDPLLRIELRAADSGTIREHEAEIRSLMERGHLRAAFVLAWSLLEASLRTLEGAATQPLRLDTVVQTLAMQGHIAPETERDVRLLIDLHHRIIHGDMEAEPTEADIRTVLSAVEEALSSQGR